MQRGPSKSSLKLAQEKDIGLATAHKAVREKLNLFPFKLTSVQKLKPADHEKRIRYSELFKNFIQTKTVDILDVTFFHMRPRSTSPVISTHKIHDLGRRRILMLCMKTFA
jgi:hypothetical protein